nr:SulP family inorganic anion transporter [Corynebacterium lizhenjunii]
MTTTAEPAAPTGVIDSFRFAFSSPRRLRIEILGGLTVSLALIPEAIAFSILAGVSPAVGLFTSVIMAMVISFSGGRPAMISAATGAIALVVAPVSRAYGLDYLVATVLLGGLLQLAFAALGVARLQRFIPRSVMLGFVNALGMMIFIAQLQHLVNVPWMVYPLTAAGIVLMLVWPRLVQAVPAPLVTIIVLGSITTLASINVPRVADMGELPSSLPSLFFPTVPWELETLRIIAPYAVGVAIVGLMESLMTAKLVDDITDVHSDKTRESFGQGVANVASGLCGGMGGCAVIGQTLINVRESGARTRLSTFLAGGFLLVLLLVLGDIVGQIPMAALVAIMMMVSIGTIDWHSLRPRTLKFMPVSETVAMGVTMAGTLLTHNLAVGVIAGVLTATLTFAHKVAHLVRVEREGRDVYRITGQLFWASSNDLVYQFDYTDPPERVVIDLSGAEVWDASTVATLDSITRKYHERGAAVEIIGLDGPSRARLDKLTGQLGD